MRFVHPKPEHEVYLDDLKEALRKHEHLPPLELLAIASQLVGSLIAFQDQRRVSPEMAMEVVARNIEEGNAMAIQSTLGKTKGRA